MTRLRLLLLKNKTTPHDPYKEIFTSAGHDPEFIPLLNHAPTDIDATVDYLTSLEFLDNTQKFIITSQRAVEVLHECLDIIAANDPSHASIIRRKCGYTVGPATEQILLDKGFLDVRGGCESGNGSKLADLILGEKATVQVEKDDEQSIVFFTGTIRKDIIPVKLKQNGVKVQEVVIYKTEPKDSIVDNFLECCEKDVDWVVFFSPQGTEDIVSHMAGVLPQNVRVASIGPTTEEYLLMKGITPHVVAPLPTAPALYDSITSWELNNRHS
ncbi:tetrapyrrole biosynthesis, uroporphyrinogen III synthase [Metschnikowia bicuspidata var. bicuspidata NRRL YB-4993]|uniref:Tetrapyrrole biosynthesis, uroporphyrinogen III synthase n=1 Tax=Metschnikowia bicuspidata var. bicuspidata NRRL YB-4993 TaxID=869754 RepID=A0A1A0H7C1_9ASCO|nr:tetrapyrrole biosynthesis, uroporphyrinogen III synthase [Metschnikowia bicuspidata var. bicuspidata NRRL YB-4993]OBA19798.1 tetrapyrrole biosynthesis, uroporphyrinogen III synthase [Metschnikowia bicuspidata var. bicuspidata NRRL YB-4993]